MFCCANVHSDDEKMNLFIEVLLDTTGTVVSRYRESVHRLYLTFKHLTHFAKSEEDTFHQVE